MQSALYTLEVRIMQLLPQSNPIPLV